MSAVKVKTLIGKEQDTENWNADGWQGPDKAQDIKPINSDECASPGEPPLHPP